MMSVRLVSAGKYFNGMCLRTEIANELSSKFNVFALTVGNIFVGTLLFLNRAGSFSPSLVLAFCFLVSGLVFLLLSCCKKMTDDELQRAIYAVTGWDCEQFFDRHVEGLIDPPFEEVLPLAGLNVSWIEADDPYVGIGFGEEEMELAIREGTPAGDAGQDHLVVDAKVGGGPQASL